jgi:NAD(P)-dependent dehydrogenase (short-subunit alcohol dehydrogenase family)
MKLKGRIALITGAGSGFGKEVAIQMAREGAKIGVNDVNTSAIEETRNALEGVGAESMALPADVGDVDQVKGMFAEIKSAWGTIDILVNNAGIVFKPGWEDYAELHNAAPLKAIGEIMETGKVQESMKIVSSFKDEWWHETLNVILNGTFYCTREALKIMEEKGSGKIINMASTTGLSGEPNVPAYATAKGGVIAFTKSVAKEVIGSGIIVNAVAPGYCDTPLLNKIDEQLLGALKTQIPCGRLGTSKEIASLVTYLATDDADYMVGQVISPNGGLVI